MRGSELGRLLTALLAAAWLAAAGLAGAGLAGPRAWASEPTTMSYAVIQQRLPDVIAHVARAGGWSLEVDPSIRGELSGARLSGTALGIIERLCEEHNLYLYSDGVRHVVASPQKVKVAMIAVRQVDQAGAVGAIRALFPRLPVGALRFAPDGGLILAGPDEVVAAAQAAVAQSRAGADVTVIRFGAMGGSEGGEAAGRLPSLAKAISERTAESKALESRR